MVLLACYLAATSAKESPSKISDKSNSKGGSASAQIRFGSGLSTHGNLNHGFGGGPIGQFNGGGLGGLHHLNQHPQGGRFIALAPGGFGAGGFGPVGITPGGFGNGFGNGFGGGFGNGFGGGFGGGHQNQLTFPGHHHVGPIIPATDPLSAAIAGNPANLPVSTGCRFWCRTPQGQAYCCEDVNQAQTQVVTKPGVCPPIRPSCPPTRSFPPASCSNDGSCVGVDKCCFDTCIQQHTCKPPQGIGRR